ncbi:MAG: bifunctional glutamate N-acetyltransferase/amino-acid acetyltransferase ArgJ [Ahrensia sp.]|nr:bifunctional glutamate N-acetyltransferase/amino-acid acetyltransferase ArgJ [Ahrensia sp.]
MAISPLAPKSFAKLPPIAGARMASCEAGIKYAGRKDLLLMLFDEPAAVAGVFTRSKCPSAPVDWCRALLAGSNEAKARAVVVNAGNANAFTGQKGANATLATARAAAATANCHENEVYLASTGVIGEPLDAPAFTHYLDDLHARAHSDDWHEAAKAIMTTDTYPKLATRTVDLNGHSVTINGIAKGSGMIAPDMATMLAFIVTDARIGSGLLQSLLSQHVGSTFNSVTVDSDTSTSDTVLLFACGGSSAPALDSLADSRVEAFSAALHALMHDLAQQIVRDGEGATKLVEIAVEGAVSDVSAHMIAKSVANSPLVKTAIAGEDANWGRVVMAVGKAGEPADRDRLTISFGDVRVAMHGERDPGYSEEEASAVMRADEIRIAIDLGMGEGKARMWTCDLTKEYVAINGDYRS